MANPWESEPSYIEVGGMKQILAFHSTICPSENLNQERLPRFSSVEFTHLLKELSKKSKTLAEINLEVKRRRIYEHFFSILKKDILDGLISMVDFLSKHLKSLIEQRNSIIEKLQEGQTGECLLVEYAYHNETCNFFEGISSNLNDLNQSLANIEWYCKTSIMNNSMTRSLECVSSALLSLQNNYQALQQSRETMQTLVHDKNTLIDI